MLGICVGCCCCVCFLAILQLHVCKQSPYEDSVIARTNQSTRSVCCFEILSSCLSLDWPWLGSTSVLPGGYVILACCQKVETMLSEAAIIFIWFHFTSFYLCFTHAHKTHSILKPIGRAFVADSLFVCCVFFFKFIKRYSIKNLD